MKWIRFTLIGSTFAFGLCTIFSAKLTGSALMHIAIRTLVLVSSFLASTATPLTAVTAFAADGAGDDLRDDEDCAPNVVSGDNWVSGCGNVVSGNGNVVTGNGNIVSGNNNRVYGNYQIVSGDNGVYGD